MSRAAVHLMSLVLMGTLLAPTSATEAAPRDLTRVAPATDVPRGLQCLWHAYPNHICQVKRNTLVWCDGTEMIYDTGQVHGSHDALLNAPDLQDMMAMRYPAGPSDSPPAKNVEPGRVRYEPFFRKMYGDSRRAVAKHTTRVSWLDGRRVRVTTINDVHARLDAVREAVRALPLSQRRIVKKTAGAFNWRTIRGTSRLSMHSFAVAIDVGVSYADYWKWQTPKRNGAPLSYRNRIPLAVVAIFEEHGFVWGGKWYHYDTMHFEYRPELLHPLCAP